MVDISHRVVITSRVGVIVVHIHRTEIWLYVYLSHCPYANKFVHNKHAIWIV